MKHSIHYSILALSVLFFYACSKSNSSGGSTKPKTAVVTTFAGSGTAGNADGTGTASQFDHPYGVAIDASGKVYVGDENNALIREITSAGLVSTLAGSTDGYADGTGSGAKFFGPDGVVLDAAGNLYVADYTNNRIRKVSPAGVVTTLAGGTQGYADGTGTAAQFFSPTGIAIDGSGNLYVADTYNHRIRKITPAGVVSTLAGSGATGPGNGAYADGAALSAQFSGPQGVAVDGSGNVYVADNGNNVIREISKGGIVSTVAGSGDDGEQDGTGTAAEFGAPIGIAVDASGILYVTDRLGTVRKITPANVVTTIAGATGTSTAGAFQWPAGIAIDAAGNLYIADYSADVIRKISFQ
ncbi:MAG TPA: NHL repeat-containing protein [Puia sp.]|nr:NHL repeat-containing protein [Puia sp.]